MGRAPAAAGAAEARRHAQRGRNPGLLRGQGGEVVDPGQRGVRREPAAYRDGQAVEGRAEAEIQGPDGEEGAGRHPSLPGYSLREGVVANLCRFLRAFATIPAWVA